MNKLFVLLLLLFTGIAFGQNPNPKVTHGTRIFLGDRFWNTDSTGLKISSLKDTLYIDTLFSDAIPQQETEGIFTVNYFFESLDDSTASPIVEMRLGEDFSSRASIKDAISTFTPATSHLVKWYPWHYLFTATEGTPGKLSLNGSDSTWWVPSTYRQYRTYDADSAATRPYISDHMR